MKQGHEELTAYHCPRCGAPMSKPSGSTLYWHVDNNHPRCDITNISETVLEVRDIVPNDPPSIPKTPKQKRGTQA